MALYTDLGMLFQAVHDEVVGIGVENCTVELHDDPRSRTLGFALKRRDSNGQLNNFERQEFSADMKAIKTASAPTRVKMSTVEGRAELAALLQQGILPSF